MGYKDGVQNKNLAWILPRPRPDHYKGSMPLHCEEWLIELAKDIIDSNATDLDILNVFCGMNKYGVRVDLNKEVCPDYCVDVHELSKHISNKFDIIIADPPYSTEEAEKLYGTPPLKYKLWTSECNKLLKVGGLFIIYHKYLMPNPNPKNYEVIKRVFIGGRPYHLPRVAIYFKKKND